MHKAEVRHTLRHFHKRAAMKEHPQERPTILVIDDDARMLELCRHSLAVAGYRVLTRDRAPGCVGLILHEKPDLVLVEVNMPDMEGEAVVRLFGASKAESTTLVLLFSAMPEPLLKQKALESGAHGCLRKTADPEDLVRQVSQWLNPLATVSSRYRTPSAEYRALGSRSVPLGALNPVVESTIPAPPAATPLPPVSIEQMTDSGPSRGAQFSEPAHSGVRAPVSRRSVLFVDDDMLILSACRRAVQAEGFDVEFLLSGERALSRVLGEAAPDVIVCDVQMPGLNGLEVFRRAIEADPSWRDRFVFVTADPRSDLVSRLVELFPGPLLQKPLDDAELRRSVLRCILRATGKRAEALGS